MSTEIFQFGLWEAEIIWFKAGWVLQFFSPRKFLAPSGAQEMQIFVRLFVESLSKAHNIHIFLLVWS